MNPRTRKIIDDLTAAIHAKSGHDRGSVESHVYTEGFLLAVVAELCADDTTIYQRVIRKIKSKNS